MVLVLAGWAFGTFLYFKVTFDWAFRSDVSIVAAGLCGIVTSLAIFIVTGIYASRLLDYNWSPGTVPVSFGTVIGRTILPMIVTAAALLGVIRLIIFGFSKDLNRELRLWTYRGELHGDVISLTTIVLLPLLLHYAMVTWGTHYNANRPL